MKQEILCARFISFSNKSDHVLFVDKAVTAIHRFLAHGLGFSELNSLGVSLIFSGFARFFSHSKGAFSQMFCAEYKKATAIKFI